MGAFCCGYGAELDATKGRSCSLEEILECSTGLTSQDFTVPQEDPCGQPGTLEIDLSQDQLAVFLWKNISNQETLSSK